MKVFNYILLSCLFLVYLGQPVLAMPFNDLNEMVCYPTEMDGNNQQEMSCCDEIITNMKTCCGDWCQCSAATPFSAFATFFTKEIKLFAIHEKHRFPLPLSISQTPLLPVWTPPDIA